MNFYQFVDNTSHHCVQWRIEDFLQGADLQGVGTNSRHGYVSKNLHVKTKEPEPRRDAGPTSYSTQLQLTAVTVNSAKEYFPIWISGKYQLT